MKRSYAKHAGRRNWTRIWFIVCGVLIAAVLIAVLYIRQTYHTNLKPISQSDRTVLVTVPMGSTVNQIGKTLQDQGVIRASWAFEWYVRNNNVRSLLQAGTYNLRPNQSVPEIVSALTHGKVATNLVTILPGQRLDQIRETLINSGFSAASVDKALDPSQYAGHPALVDKPADASLEGYLYPDSFQKTTDTKPETIIKASLDEMQQHLTPQIRAALVKQGLTVHQGVILASIVGQEVGDPKPGQTNYKPTVAQVFLLRLNQGMALGSDVTAFYGAIHDGKTGLSEGQSLAYDSPYNTRLHTGLPPGPISNVTASSLDAVANPSPTDYVYFVAGDDGITYFSHTLAEHQALTAAHCKKLCGQ